MKQKNAPIRKQEPPAYWPVVFQEFNKNKIYFVQLLEAISVDVISVNGGEYHADTALESRLAVMETQIKNIQSGVDSVVSTISEVKTRNYARTYTAK